MAQLQYFKQTKIWTPSSYTTNVVDKVFNVFKGDLVGPIICRTIQAFDGTGTAAKFELGDGDDPDRYVDDGELEEISISAATSIIRAQGASGGGYVLYRSILYVVDDTIDVNFTCATGADATTGKVMITAFIARHMITA